MEKMGEAANTLLDQADAAYNQGDLATAHDLYLQVLQSDGTCLKALSRLGGIKAQQGNLDEAEAYLRQALSVNADYAPACSNLGNIFYTRGNYQDAVEQYSAAHVVDPDNVIYLRNLHAAYKKLGRHSQAVSHLKAAVRAKNRAAKADDGRIFQEWRRRIGRSPIILAGAVLLAILAVIWIRYTFSF